MKGKEMCVFVMDFFVYISKSVAVYAGNVVTEHEGNMNMGQYYS